MSTRYLIANWKMQLTDSESLKLTEEISRLIPAVPITDTRVEKVLCPSQTALDVVFGAARDAGISVGAQNVFWEDKGAYTGETSPLNLKDLGCDYCIVGHSERRTFLNENNEMVQRKVAALLRHDINPIICVGETRTERETGKRDAVIIRQVQAALAEGELRPTSDQHIIIAYEPVWVIGTGQAVSPTDAAAAHHIIRDTLREMYSADTIEKNCFVIYGGSVNATNLPDFLQEDVIEGALVGGASLKADEFIRLAELMSI